MFKLLSLVTILTAGALAQLGGGLLWPGPGLTSVPPVQPVTGMAAWYSADCITFVSSVCGVPSNGSTIATWADRSGNSLTGTIGRGTCTFNTGQINSQPAVTFSSCGIDTGAVNWQSTGVGNVFVVFKTTNTGVSNSIISGISGGLSGSSVQYFITTVQNMNVTDVNSVGSGSTSVGTIWHQGNMAFTSGTSLSFRLDRAVDTTTFSWIRGVSRANSGIGYDVAGGATFFVGQIAELIMYNTGTALTSPQITQVETYLNNKYGL